VSNGIIADDHGLTVESIKMSDLITLKGFINNVIYNPQLRPELPRYPLESFDINSSAASGVIQFGTPEDSIGYSKWVSPKRTRSYPFGCIYNTYHLPKKVTVIPIIKDEGENGDCDRINFITLSWMNLLNVYIILAWYDNARANPRKDQKITSQLFNTDYVRQKLTEIRTYHNTALHWNTHHFTQDFAFVHRQAMVSYSRIATSTGVRLHDPKYHQQTLEGYFHDGQFSLTQFKEQTLPRSYQASQRETTTKHIGEYLSDGVKSYFSLFNRLGGEYHLTADEIIQEGDLYIIQEAKNSSVKIGKLPSESDMKDGLFKLILFQNLHELYIMDQPVQFTTRLKLTGGFKGRLSLPNTESAIEAFVAQNHFTPRDLHRLTQLNKEAQLNARLSIVIEGVRT
jgi:hypothetical protein